MNFDDIKAVVDKSENILVIQGENLDADSLATSLALENILESAGKSVEMFCQVDVPTYLHYIDGWDRVVSEINPDYDMAIIVDTSSSDLLAKTLQLPEAKKLNSLPVFVIDHHDSEGDLPFESTDLVDMEASCTSQVVYEMANALELPVSKKTAEYMTQSLMADTQGLSNSSANQKSIEFLLEMVKLGVSLHELEDARRAKMKKSSDILDYKGRLISRIEYHLDGALATIHIPWEEIEEYSHAYNPSMLVIEEMKMVEGVKLAIAYKTYPDGKILAKIRCNSDALIGKDLAEHFGGGGHPGASGFKLFDKDFSTLKAEVITKVAELLND